MTSLVYSNVLFLYILSNSFDLINSFCVENTTLAEVWEDGLWDYRSIGPDTWDEYCPHFCDSTYITQSPIDINTNDVTIKEITQYSSFMNFWTWETNHTSWRVENNGHSLHLSPIDNDGPIAWLNTPHVEDNYTYQLYGIHFHWGNTSLEGSEHQINSLKYPLEVHFVHFRNDFNTITDAINDNSASNAGVVGILFELVDDEEEDETMNILLDNLTLISGYHDKMNVNDLNFYDIIMMNDDNEYDEFYYYEGSLTTPPCDPIVRWQVLKDTLKVSQRQLNQFPLLLNMMNQSLHQNWRPPQYNNNTVYHIQLTGESESIDDSMDGSIRVKLSIACIFTLVVINGVW